MKTLFNRFYSSVPGRLLAIVSTLVYLILLLIVQHHAFNSSDPIPLMQTPPKEQVSLAAPVLVGFHITNFPVFSFERKEFVVDGIAWFRFAVGSVPLEVIEQFSFGNCAQHNTNELIVKSKPLIKLLGEQVQVSYHIQVGLTADLDFKNFPLCDHTLHLIMQNKQITPEQLYFTTSEQCITLANQEPIKNWQPCGMHVQAGIMSSPLEHGNATSTISYPAVRFSLDFKDVGMKELMSLYFPMLVLFFVALFSLLLELVDNTARLTYIATVIPVLVLFRLVIDGVLPHVGYTTHVDFVYYLLVLLSLLILLFHIYAMLMLTRNAHAPVTETNASMKKRLYLLNDTVFIGCLLNLLVGMTYLYLAS